MLPRRNDGGAISQPQAFDAAVPSQREAQTPATNSNRYDSMFLRLHEKGVEVRGRFKSLGRQLLEYTLSKKPRTSKKRTAYERYMAAPAPLDRTWAKEAADAKHAKGEGLPWEKTEEYRTVGGGPRPCLLTGHEARPVAPREWFRAAAALVLAGVTAYEGGKLAESVAPSWKQDNYRIACNGGYSEDNRQSMNPTREAQVDACVKLNIMADGTNYIDSQEYRIAQEINTGEGVFERRKIEAKAYETQLGEEAKMSRQFRIARMTEEAWADHRKEDSLADVLQEAPVRFMQPLHRVASTMSPAAFPDEAKRSPFSLPAEIAWNTFGVLSCSPQ
jgi:hypothetical protein